MLNTLFGYDRPGIYVDVGAHDPAAWSNTKKLSELGWWGLNIDPLPGMVARFRKYRPRDVCLENAIGIGGSEPLFYWIYEHEPRWNCLASRAPVNHRDGRDFHPDRCVSVPIVTIADALEQAKLPQVDLINLDIEGGEEHILRAWPWQRYTPRAICVEVIGQPAAEIAHNPLTHFLAERGMVFTSQLICSVIYLQRDFLATCYPQAHSILAAAAQ